MTPELSAAVDRIILQSGRSAERRDEEHDRGNADWRGDYNAQAAAYGFAACHAAEAGLCDIHVALDRDDAADELGTRNPTAQQYAARVRRAVDANL